VNALVSFYYFILAVIAVIIGIEKDSIHLILLAAVFDIASIYYSRRHRKAKQGG